MKCIKIALKLDSCKEVKEANDNSIKSNQNWRNNTKKSIKLQI
jgi:hypothetical protein